MGKGKMASGTLHLQGGRKEISCQDKYSISTDKGCSSNSLGHWSIIALLRKLKKI